MSQPMCPRCGAPVRTRGKREEAASFRFSSTATSVILIWITLDVAERNSAWWLDRLQILAAMAVPIALAGYSWWLWLRARRADNPGVKSKSVAMAEAAAALPQSEADERLVAKRVAEVMGDQKPRRIGPSTPPGTGRFEVDSSGPCVAALTAMADEREPVEYDTAVGMLKVSDGSVHTIIQSGSGLVVASWSLEAVRDHIRLHGAELAGHFAVHLGHALVSRDDGRLVFFAAERAE